MHSSVARKPSREINVVEFLHYTVHEFHHSGRKILGILVLPLKQPIIVYASICDQLYRNKPQHSARTSIRSEHRQIAIGTGSLGVN